MKNAIIILGLLNFLVLGALFVSLSDTKKAVKQNTACLGDSNTQAAKQRVIRKTPKNPTSVAKTYLRILEPKVTRTTVQIKP